MAADRDVVLAKAAQVDRALSRVASTLGGDPERLQTLDVADIVTLNLQQACQACIDLAQHLVASEGLGLPTTVAEAFTLLAQSADLDRDLAKSLRAMVGFRNVAMHSYDELDEEVLLHVAVEGVQDLRRFVAWAVSRG